MSKEPIMSKRELSAIRAAVRAAADWEGWEWTHDPGGVPLDGPGFVGTADDWDRWEKNRVSNLWAQRDRDRVRGVTSDEDEAEPEDIANAERVYGENCQRDAERAAEHGAEALLRAESGHMRAALMDAEAALELESKYGDPVLYHKLVRVIETTRA